LESTVELRSRAVPDAHNPWFRDDIAGFRDVIAGFRDVAAGSENGQRAWPKRAC